MTVNQLTTVMPNDPPKAARRTTKPPKNERPDAWAMIPAAVLSNTELSIPARLLFAILDSRQVINHDVRVGHAVLAADMGCTTRYVRQLIKELRAAGLLKTRRTGRTSYWVVINPLRESFHDEMVANYGTDWPRPTGTSVRAQAVRDRKKGKPARTGEQIVADGRDATRAEARWNNVRNTPREIPETTGQNAQKTASIERAIGTRVPIKEETIGTRVPIREEPEFLSTEKESFRKILKTGERDDETSRGPKLCENGSQNETKNAPRGISPTEPSEQLPEPHRVTAYIDELRRTVAKAETKTTKNVRNSGAA